jgi:hypothetical protein
MQTLSSQVQPEDLVAAHVGAEPPKDTQGKTQDKTETPEEIFEKFHKMKKEMRGVCKEQRSKEVPENVQDLTERFGTLLVKQGRSRYINPGFWSHLNAEVSYEKTPSPNWDMSCLGS